MKYPFILLVLSVIAITAWRTGGPDQGSRDETAPPITKSAARPHPADRPFWETAVVPEPPARERPLVVVAASQPKPVDYPARMAELHRSGEAHEINHTLVAWFDADPEASSEWISSLAGFEAIQPALRTLSVRVAENGDPANALEWAALLTPGIEREQSLFDIYAIAARGRYFSEEQLKSAPLPPERLAELLGGAAGD